MTPQNNEMAVWILTAVVGLLGVVLWWSIRGWVKGINEKITEMMGELRVVGNKNIGFEKDIQRIDSRIDREYESHEERLRDHADRIREVELTQKGCRNCNVK